MTAETDNVQNHWAFLIGINYYRQDQCLEGSVRDTETVKRYLEAGTAPVDITILTATTPRVLNSYRPIEKEEQWPTYVNVVAGLQRLIRETKPGDCVYIHYSGHGTRIAGTASSGHSDSERLALVLFEDNEIGSSYLRGHHLASALRKMVEKGLLVTLVLDCCFSGSIDRKKEWQGFDIRSTDYKPEIDAFNLQGYNKSLFSDENTLRNSRIEKSWLVDPDGYTILSACGPHELAWELEVEGERRGALSYFLLDTLSTLRKSHVTLSHQSLHEHIRSIFHVSWPKQTPMRYGNANLSFFGSLLPKPDAKFEFVYRKEGGDLCLRSGQVHGVCKGDKYAVYPFETPERVAEFGESIMVRVNTVRCFESNLVEDTSASVATQIQTGWKARLVTCLSRRKIRVKVLGSIGTKQPWVEAAEGRHFLHPIITEEDTGIPDFNITLHNGAYEVLDALQEDIVNLPSIPVNSDGAISTVMDVVEHLATFKYFEGIKNRYPSPEFENSFSILPQCSTEASGQFIVRHGGIWGFTAENMSDKPLYMAIFNFNPSWEVSNLVLSSGGDSYMVLPPRTEEGNRTTEIKLQMEVPPNLQELGLTHCEDVVKVFVTSKPTSFPMMLLPEIQLVSGKVTEHIRRRHDVSLFLSELDTKFRGHRDGGEAQWATRNFIIQTVVE